MMDQGLWHSCDGSPVIIMEQKLWHSHDGDYDGTEGVR